MALQPRPELTFEHWLQGEREALDERCDYVDGEIYAMSGGSAEHHAIISNINREPSYQCKGRPCHVYGQGMRLHIAAADAGKYPDLMTLCDEQHSQRRWTLAAERLRGSRHAGAPTEHRLLAAPGGGLRPGRSERGRPIGLMGPSDGYAVR